MLLKDKLIIVFYVGVEGCGMVQANEKLAYAHNYFESIKDESTVCIFVPDFETRSCKVEAINPKRISDEEYEKVSEIVEDYKDRFKKFDENRSSYDQRSI